MTPTLGTFTRRERRGRWIRVLKTVRYYFRLRAWVNKIGLRNPGIAWLASRVDMGKIDPRGKLLSIHGFEESEWFELLELGAQLKPLALELNMSCPNVGEINWPESLFDRAADLDVPVVVKIPPVRYHQLVETAVEAGLKTFHCCNTLPIPAGGLSGAPLKPVSIECIGELRTDYAEAGLQLIGGGGICTPQDIDDYSAAGADQFALGTKVMHPRYLLSTRSLAPLLDRAQSHGSRATRVVTPESR